MRVTMLCCSSGRRLLWSLSKKSVSDPRSRIWNCMDGCPFYDHIEFIEKCAKTPANIDSNWNWYLIKIVDDHACNKKGWATNDILSSARKIFSRDIEAPCMYYHLWRCNNYSDEMYYFLDFANNSDFVVAYCLNGVTAV